MPILHTNLTAWSADPQFLFDQVLAFTAADAGKMLNVTGGTGWVPGLYAIVAVLVNYADSRLPGGMQNLAQIMPATAAPAGTTGGQGSVPSNGFTASIPGANAIAGKATPITFSGTGTAWNSGTVFTPSNGTLSNVVVTSATSATATWKPAPLVLPARPISATFSTVSDGTTGGIPVISARITAGGNSIQRGQDTSNPPAAQGPVTPANTDGVGIDLNYLGAGWIGSNYAVSGWTTTQMAADWTANNRDSMLADGYPLNVLVAGEGTNELAQRVNAQYPSADTTACALAAYNVMVAFCQERRAAGWKVVATTILPRSEPAILDKAANEIARLKYNILVRQNWRAWADAISDPASDARIGYSGAELDPTLYANVSTADTRVHPTTLGKTYQEGYTAAAVDSIGTGGGITGVAFNFMGIASMSGGM